MTVLVAYASKHGATAEIAQAIGEELRAAGLDVDVREAAEVTSVDGHEAVVLGSAVYAGHWLGEAREVLERHGEALAARPVWLFSSGPIGDPPKPDEDPVDVAQALEATRAREHRLFAGRLERARLGWAEKAIVIALRAPDGDFRDWDAIRAWAREIAAAVQAEARAR